MVVSANFPNRPFALQIDAALVSQDISRNVSRFYGWVRIHKNSYSPTWSGNPVSSYQVFSSGRQLAAQGGMTFDFRNGTDFPLWDGYWEIAHNPDGSLGSVSFEAYANYDLLGYTQVGMNIAVPNIPRGPRVFYANQWRNTVPYVFYGGQWRVAVPYVFYGNQWRIGGS